MRLQRNGKLVEVPEGSTVDDLPRLFPDSAKDQILVEDPTLGTRLAEKGAQLQEGQSLWTIPPIVKG